MFFIALPKRKRRRNVRQVPDSDFRHAFKFHVGSVLLIDLVSSVPLGRPWRGDGRAYRADVTSFAAGFSLHHSIILLLWCGVHSSNLIRAWRVAVKTIHVCLASRIDISTYHHRLANSGLIRDTCTMSSSIFAVATHKIIESTLVCRIGEYPQRISHLELACAGISKKSI